MRLFLSAGIGGLTKVLEDTDDLNLFECWYYGNIGE